MSNSSNVLKNAIAFLQVRYPKATVLNSESSAIDGATGDTTLTFWPMIVHDPNSGMKQRAIAISQLDDRQQVEILAGAISGGLFQEVDARMEIGFGSLDPKGHTIDSTQMAWAPRLIIYAGEVGVPYRMAMDVFAAAGVLVEIFDETEMLSTLFISYGGADEEAASKINTYLKERGVKTWFFPVDALPGEKLHRMMHDGVNNHDRVLLLCSETALSRPGVLNEIERVLEREAKEGGSQIMLPITLDDYVYRDWAPTKRDIASQVRSRVITKIGLQSDSETGLSIQLEKLVKALSRKA